MTNATQVVRRAAKVVSTNDIRDIVPPVLIPSGWAWVGWTLLVLAAAALAGLAWRWWRKRKIIRAIPPIIPPHVRARQRLEEALALLDQPRQFCICVSDTVRLYLEERFDFHAPERTTEEFLLELKSTELLLSDQKESLGEFLTRCDLVKFARYEPARRELLDLHGSALRLVEETAPKPEPSVPHVASPDKPATTRPSDVNGPLPVAESRAEAADRKS